MSIAVELVVKYEKFENVNNLLMAKSTFWAFIINTFKGRGYEHTRVSIFLGLGSSLCWISFFLLLFMNILGGVDSWIVGIPVCIPSLFVMTLISVRTIYNPDGTSPMKRFLRAVITALLLFMMIGIELKLGGLVDWTWDVTLLPAGFTLLIIFLFVVLFQIWPNYRWRGILFTLCTLVIFSLITIWIVYVIGGLEGDEQSPFPYFTPVYCVEILIIDWFRSKMLRMDVFVH